MWKRRVNGKKNNNGGHDRPMQIMTDGWEIPTNDDILELIDVIFENEDEIYPRPKFKGSGLFMDEIIKQYANYLEKNKDKNDKKLDGWM